MNKKFSTLVASVLLASSVGVVGAQTVAPTYSMFNNAGVLAKSLNANGAFQLADGDGKVLAMVATEVNGKKVLKLKMVAADSNTKLAETLWKVRWTAGTDQVKKYYFTFESAAYGMPLSFSTENAGIDGLSATPNYEFPGKIATWEWQDGLEGAGIASTGVAMRYRFANPDSIMTLSADANGAVGAIKYAGKNQQNKALLLKPMTVAETVLTADDLNSMMLSDTKTKTFNLQFFKNVQNAEFGNLWTDKDLKAVPVVDYSTIMYKQEEVPSGKYDANQIAAAKAAKAAADALVVPTTVTNVIPVAATAGQPAWDATAITWATSVKATSAAGTTFTESLDAVNAAVAAKKAAVGLTTADKLASAAINDVVKVWDFKEITGVNNTKADLETVVDDADASTLVAANQAAVPALFKAAITLDNDGTEFTTSKAAVAALAGKFTIEIPTVIVKNDNAAILAWVDENVDATVVDIVKAEIGVLTDVADANTAIAKLTTYATDVNGAIDALAFTQFVPAWDLAKFKTEYAKISTEAGTGYSAEQITAVKKAISDQIDLLVTAAGTPDQAQKVVADKTTDYAAISATADLFTPAVNAITAAIIKMNSFETVKAAILVVQKDFDNAGDAIIVAISETVTAGTLLEAVAAVNIDEYTNATEPGIIKDPAMAAQYVSIKLGDETYLAVDTNVIAGTSGARHLKFAEWTYNNAMTDSKGEPLSTKMNRDYIGHFNFNFTYYPTADSLVILTDGNGMKPKEDVANWVDMTDTQLEASYDYDANGKIVKLAVLTDKHSEVTVGEYENITGAVGIKDQTLNTRIGFNVNFTEGVAIPAGVYTVQYVSKAAENATLNGRFITYNWLNNNVQAMASVEDQDLNHIPAAQWIVTQAKGENLNSIVNRESAEPMAYTNDFGLVQHQYMFKTATPNLYTNINKDSLLFTAIAEDFCKDSTLGYFAALKNNEETIDQLKVYALSYLNEVEGLTVSAGKDSILNVAKNEADDMVYFRLIPAMDAPVSYGAFAKDIAKELKRQAYYLQLETPNKNIKDEDKLFITVTTDGKYKLINSDLNAKKVATYTNLNAFFIKEFKDTTDVHYYALIEAVKNINGLVTGELGSKKISVKDYPSILVTENLEGENTGNSYGWLTNGRTSTFAMTEKDAPKYRRLGVTNADDKLNDLDVNNAKFNITRESGRFLFENTKNSVAGYEGKPTGINYLGASFDAKNATVFVDTAYVRGNTKRPQYMLALRPDSTTLKVPCNDNVTHPFDEIPQVRASYLVTLTDSVAAYTDKNVQDKFMYENRTYIRLAFVDAIHRNDSLLILDSKFAGTKNAGNDSIYLGNNSIANNGAFQFRLTENNDKNAEFYIETAGGNSFVKLINGVAVLTQEISDAERFNIATTTELPTDNEGIETTEVSVIAGVGSVTINNAAGKKVAISNILGQTIAQTVITSDNATISVPAGIVVVSVEGEAAVKAIVK